MCVYVLVRVSGRAVIPAIDIARLNKLMMAIETKSQPKGVHKHYG